MVVSLQLEAMVQEPMATTVEVVPAAEILPVAVRAHLAVELRKEDSLAFEDNREMFVQKACQASCRGAYLVAVLASFPVAWRNLAASVRASHLDILAWAFPAGEGTQRGVAVAAAVAELRQLAFSRRVEEL